MSERRAWICLCLALCLVSFCAIGASAQAPEYAQNLFAPVLQSTPAGDLGIALSNPSLSSVQVIATARSYAGDTITGVGITNPVILTLAPSTQRALTASELFGSGITGFTGWIAFQSPSTAISGLFLLFDGNLTNIDGGELVNTRQTRILFPKVFSTAGNSSTVTVVNTSSSKFDTILSIYDNSSALLSQQIVSIPAYSGISKTAAELVPNSSFSGYATAVSLVGVPTLVGMVKYVNRADSAVLPAMPLAGGLKSAYIPHLAFGGGYSSRIGIVNPEGVDQTVHLTAYLSDAFGANTTVTADRVLSARTRIEEDLASAFGVFPASLISGYIRLDVVTDTPGVASYIEFGTTDGILLSAVPAQGSGYSDYFFSHVAEGLGYYTGLALLNPNAETVPVAIDIIGRDGARVGGTVLSLAGGERRTRLISELIPGTIQLGGYVRVSSTRNIYAIELFGSSTSLRFAANVSARGTQVTPLLSGNSITQASGALLVSADTSVSQLIPPTALSLDSPIQLNPIDPSTFPKPFADKTLVAAVEALPLGTQFNIPTRLTFPIGLQLIPGTQVPLYIQSPLTHFQFQLSEFVGTVDDTGRNAVANITHFSTYGVVWPDSQMINVSSISPAQGTSGSILTINGTGLNASPGTTVTFAGPDNTSITAPLIALTSSSIQVLVPAGVISGNVFVRAGAKSSQGMRFTSLNPNPSPTITSVTPPGISAAATTFVSVLVTGTGFNSRSVGILSDTQYPTLYLGPTSLRIEIAGPIPTGLYQIGVVNPGPGGGTATMPWYVLP